MKQKQMSPVDALAAILAARKMGKGKVAQKKLAPRAQKFKAPQQMPAVFMPPPSA